jgi:hypothetical protein
MKEIEGNRIAQVLLHCAGLSIYTLGAERSEQCTEPPNPRIKDIGQRDCIIDGPKATIKANRCRTIAGSGIIYGERDSRSRYDS